MHDRLAGALRVARTYEQIAADAGAGNQAKKNLAKARKPVGKFVAGVRTGKKVIDDDAVREALLATARGVRAALRQELSNAGRRTTRRGARDGKPGRSFSLFRQLSPDRSPW